MKVPFLTAWPDRSQFASLAIAVLLSLGAAGMLLRQSIAVGGERAVLVPPPVLDQTSANTDQAKAVFAGGCFWGVQGVFQHVKGVTNAVSGYAGGKRIDAHYENVGSGRTGHAESVEVTYDPHQITYGELLRIYFSVAHDPTQKNRQGPDTGTQYRSAIFPQDDEQQRIAQAYIAQLDQANTYGAPLATTLEPGKTFYAAEDYHQDFLAHNPTYGYIVINDLPKIDHLKQLFPERYRAEAKLTK
jgi:peptide-methionine (S)-S-oxide reductase